ncbi:MAG: NAD-dependent DNA ligase LigA [Planctomycetota bacterium]|nr:NAD-dependent DNA ligase LigA [Planctomycetota bacterium]
MANRISELRNLILKAKQAYYYGGNAIMTDAEYDALEDELRKLKPDDDVLALVGAPVPPDSILTKATHSIHMGSQSKCNTTEEFLTWFEKSADGSKIHASLKADGASAAAYYTDGQVSQVISRGDGLTGEDITANGVKFKGLPAYIETSDGPFNGAVRFEVVLTVADWKKLDPSMAKNPRNLGSGIMGRKNGQDSEYLSVFAFGISQLVDGNEVTFRTEEEKANTIQELGFDLMPNRMCKSADAAIAYYEHITETRNKLPFWIDGVVMKVNDIAHQESLGITSHRPKGQIAWKFEAEGAETILKSYSISGGHTGALVPNAQLQPVEIGGTTVSNALLNNWEEIERLNVAVNDTVYVIKANDIIPKVIEVRKRAKNRKRIPEPRKCPFCNSKAERRKNPSGDIGAVTVCTNADCEIKSTGKIKRWIKSLDIQGIGDSVLNALVEQVGIEDAAGLYRLHEKKQELPSILINTEKEIRLGSKRANVILEEIDQKRSLTLVEFLGSLGIDHLGKRRVEIMIKGAGGQLNTLASWRDGRLRKPEVAEAAGAPTMAEAIQNKLDDASDVIDGLLAAGVIVTDVSEGASAPVALKTFCITGSLPSGKKKGDYSGPLADAGYELVDKVTKELDYLVMADPTSTSSKATKARSYGIELIGEDELNKLIDSGKTAQASKPKKAAKKAGQLSLFGDAEDQKTICITGSLPSGKKKKDYAAPLQKAGYKLVDQVTPELDFLVLSDPSSTSSKAKKARQYGTKMLDEDGLVELLG